MPTNSPPVYNGRYELSHQIARGGTAQVYLARDLLLDRPVALKMLFPELSTDRTFVDRFRREAQAAANLSHPNIVPVFDWGESDRTYYIVMEYVDGEPLSAIIRTQAPLDGVQACGIAADIAKALSYAHRHGVVHRDVKPGNVLITSDGQVKVTDFGIARAIGSDENVTQTGLVMGTATYFSPEQAQGLGVDGRSDVYSLGVVLFEMLTGRPPFSGESPVSIAYQHVREPAPTPRSLNPAIPVPLEAIIMQAMAKQPSERYPTAQDFQADLQRYCQGGTVMAFASSFGGAQAPPAGSSGGNGAGAAVAAAGLAAGAAATTALPAERAAAPATAVMGSTAAAGAGVATRQTFAPTPALAGTPSSATSSTFAAPPAITAAPPRRVEGKPPLPKTHTLQWAIAAVVLMGALVAVVFAGGRALGYFGGKAWFPAPSLTQDSLSEAKATLQKDGLGYGGFTSQYDSSASGTVLDQHPPDGTSVQAGTVFTLVVSKGPQYGTVPGLTGLTEATAMQNLNNDHFKVTVKPINGTPQEKGYVEGQNPVAGTTLQEGQTVTIDVVTGLSSKAIPQVDNEPQSQAYNTLVNDGFKVSNDTVSQTSPTVPQGDVIATNPAPGAVEPIGTLVTLTISSGKPPPQVPIPIVTGDTPTQADSTLTGKGFQATNEFVPVCSVVENNIVQETNPVGGTSAPEGSSVTVEVGSYQPGSPACATTSTTNPPTSSTVAGTTGNTGAGGQTGGAPGGGGGGAPSGNIATRANGPYAVRLLG